MRIKILALKLIEKKCENISYEIKPFKGPADISAGPFSD